MRVTESVNATPEAALEDGDSEMVPDVEPAQGEAAAPSGALSQPDSMWREVDAALQASLGVDDVED
eukprot:7372025-Prymnesium_polylepis.2